MGATDSFKSGRIILETRSDGTVSDTWTGSAAQVTMSYKAQATGYSTTGATVTTSSGISVSAGDLAVVFYVWGTDVAPLENITFSDSVGGNTWNRQTQFNYADYYLCCFGWSQIANGGASMTFTVTRDTSSSDVKLAIVTVFSKDSGKTVTYVNDQGGGDHTSDFAPFTPDLSSVTSTDWVAVTGFYGDMTQTNITIENAAVDAKVPAAPFNNGWTGYKLYTVNKASGVHGDATYTGSGDWNGAIIALKAT